MMYLKKLVSKIQLETFLLKLNQPLRKTNYIQNKESYLAPTFWNNLPDSLKASENLSTYKLRLKNHNRNKAAQLSCIIPAIAL